MVAAFRVDEHVGAFRALAGQVLGKAVIVHFLGVFRNDVLFQYTGNGVRARENGLTLFPGDRRAADAAQLFDDKRHVNTGL